MTRNTFHHLDACLDLLKQVKHYEQDLPKGEGIFDERIFCLLDEAIGALEGILDSPQARNIDPITGAMMDALEDLHVVSLEEL